jgi:hypothetical protein
LRQRQIAFGDNTVVPLRYVSYAVTRLKLIVGCWHEVADLVIPCSVMRIAWGKMDCLSDGELVGQICLLYVTLNKTFRELNKYN